MPDGAASFEVISVVRRRRRWTSEQKLALIQEIETGGASLASVADRHGVSRSLLFEWRRQLREGNLPGVSRAGDAEPKSFAPVRVIENASAAPAAISPSRSPRPAVRQRAPVPIVELVLRNGRVLRIAETMAPDALGRMAAALDGEC